MLGLDSPFSSGALAQGKSLPSLGLSFSLCKMGRNPGLPNPRGIVQGFVPRKGH